jgi:hypothetical protein
MNRAAFQSSSTISRVPRCLPPVQGAGLALLLALALPAIAQMGMAAAELQQKLAAVKESVAANQKKLHQYEWTETMELTLKGDPRPPRKFLCRYAPDGTVEKTPIGVQSAASGGRLRQRIVARKTEEMQDYMGQVKNLLAMYVPPGPQKMTKAYQAGNALLNPNPGAQTIALVFKNYAQSGDEMTLAFDTTQKKVTGLHVNTYMDDPKDVVTLSVQMGTLPDGTNYVDRSILDATAKKLQVMTTNSDYQKLAP